MLPFPMFRPRQSRPHPQLPSASIQYVSVPATCARHLPRSARRSSTCDLASLLPPVTSHASPITNSFRIRTYEKHAPNPFRIRTSETQHLKPLRMNTYKKPGVGPPSWLCRNSWNDFCPERRTRAQDLSGLPAEILPASLNRDKKGPAMRPGKSNTT